MKSEIQLADHKEMTFSHFERAINTLLVRTALTIALAVLSGAARGDVQYTYDGGGRLTGVITASGDAAQYVYDAAGNISEIKRLSSTTLSLIEFQPRSGPVGSTVTIWGTGFSTVPSNNVVTFNGVVATVVSASGNKLVVAVPSTATNGMVQVAVSAATATSPGGFIVTTPIACATRVTNVSPLIGATGAAITITGSGFDRGANATTFNGVLASAGTASATSLTIAVPAGATSGPLQVATIPLCRSASVADFFVPPPGFAASDLGVTGRLALNGPPMSGTLAPTKRALYVFDAHAPVGAGAYLTSSTLGSVSVEVRAPDGSLVTSSTFSTSSGQAGPLALPMTGGYTVFINPTSGAGGTFTIRVGAPDLAISSPTVGSITLNQNGSFNLPVSFVVSNIGSISTTTGWSDYAFLSRSPTLDPTAQVAGSTLRSSGLASGASYTVNQTYVATGVTPGPYYLFVRTDTSATGLADGNGTVLEASEANNISSIPITLPPYPDLAASNGSVGTIVVNQNGSFTVPTIFTVTNVGLNSAIAPWSDFAYLSPTSTHQSSGLVLGSALRNTALASGGSYVVSQSHTVSGVGPGSYTLFLKADGQTGVAQVGSGAVAEMSESNNEVAVSVVLPGYPDLVVSNASLGAVTESQNGNFSIPVSFTVTNSGSSPAQPNWNDFAYISSNGVLDASSTSIGSAFKSVALGVGASYSVNQTYTTTRPPGNYTIFVRADGSSSPTGGGFLTEASETNNVSPGLSVVLPAYPDLVISNASVGTITKNVNNTWNIPLTYTVTNSGGVPAQPGWNDFGFIAANGILDASSSAIGSSFRSTALAVGASYTTTKTFVTAAISPGNYSVFVRVDGTTSPTATGAVVEGSKSNNVSAPLSVTLN